MTGRAWLASAGWAFLFCVAGQVFITAAAIALFVLFFSAVVTAIFPPSLLLLGAGEGTGWQVVLAVAGTGLVVLGLSGGLTRWAFRRCRCVVFPLESSNRLQWSWARRSSVLVGVLASFVFVMVVPAFIFASVPGPPTVPAERPDTSGTV